MAKCPRSFKLTSLSTFSLLKLSKSGMSWSDTFRCTSGSHRLQIKARVGGWFTVKRPPPFSCRLENRCLWTLCSEDFEVKVAPPVLGLLKWSV